MSTLFDTAGITRSPQGHSTSDVTMESMLRSSFRVACQARVTHDLAGDTEQAERCSRMATAIQRRAVQLGHADDAHHFALQCLADH